MPPGGGQYHVHDLNACVCLDSCSAIVHILVSTPSRAQIVLLSMPGSQPWLRHRPDCHAGYPQQASALSWLQKTEDDDAPVIRVDRVTHPRHAALGGHTSRPSLAADCNPRKHPSEDPMPLLESLHVLRASWGQGFSRFKCLHRPCCGN